MQVVRTVVGGELVFFAVEREVPPGDPIGATADQGAEVGTALEVAVEVVEPEHDVGERAVAVGDVQLGDDRPVVGDLQHQAVGVLQGVQLHGFALKGAPVGDLVIVSARRGRQDQEEPEEGKNRGSHQTVPFEMPGPHQKIT